MKMALLEYVATDFVFNGILIRYVRISMLMYVMGVSTEEFWWFDYLFYGGWWWLDRFREDEVCWLTRPVEGYRFTRLGYPYYTNPTTVLTGLFPQSIVSCSGIGHPQAAFIPTSLSNTLSITYPECGLQLFSSIDLEQNPKTQCSMDHLTRASVSHFSETCKCAILMKNITSVFLF